ncbi:hypothetical protein KFL_000900050 [Klebsormidium nitens]|uniref:Uncharacterized protein n=1 Tax=Klebsormidium nitens TaxID=105231 RepID=A0A0U9HLK4_KLENI|nr:hypothetical protein KFL_000900050 [Klebsormidium nitens]|eukprot:GAQ81750.1 hypothetical protein KFL_000900050 [Klebsormidium nitens]
MGRRWGLVRTDGCRLCWYPRVTDPAAEGVPCKGVPQPRSQSAMQPGRSGATADDVSRPEDVSSSKEAAEESPEAVSWVRRKWAENRAEYERLRGVLKDLGLAGFLSYGLFNTGYYLVSFLFVWFFVSPSPGGLGVAQAAKRFIKIFAMVWAGSQVTKLLRAGGALLLAPLVDRGLDWFTAKGSFRSKSQAFWAIVGSCIALALVIFVVIVSLWA